MTAANVSAPLVDGSAARDRLYRKIELRIVPFLLVCYMICRLDTASFGYAKLQFVAQLGFTEAVYGFGAGLFYLGYALFEIPSNLYMHRYGIRRLLIRIMVLWGLVTMAAMFMRTSTHFYAARFVLGVAEGGFLPGVLLYMTYWFPPDKRAKAFSLFMIANPIAGILGGLLAGWIMKYFAGLFGLHGWQALLLFLSAPAVILGLAAWFCLSDTPQAVKWLTEEERLQVEEEIASEGQRISKKSSLMSAFSNPKVYVAAIVYYTVVSSLTMLTVWAPTIVKSFGLKDIGLIGVVTAMPYLAGMAGMIVVARSSDRRMERRWHFVASSALSGLSLLTLCAVHHQPVLAVICLCTMGFGLFGAYAIFFTMPASMLDKAAAAGGIALITTVGNLSGFFMPWATGAIQTATGSLYTAIAVIAVVGLAGSALVAATMTQRAPAR